MRLKNFSLLIISLLVLGLGLWIIETILLSFTIKKDFVQILLLKIPLHQIYIRFISIGFMSILGIVIFLVIKKFKFKTKIKFFKRKKDLQNKYQYLLNSIPNSVFIINRSWKTVAMNITAKNAVNIPEKVIHKYNIIELLPDFQNTIFYVVLKRVMTKREHETIVGEYTFLDGHKRWFEVRVYPVPEGIMCITIDITEKKEAEEKLRYSEEKFRNIFNESFIPMVLFDLEGYILDANHSLINLIEHPLKKVKLHYNLFKDKNLSKNIKEKIIKGEKVNFIHKTGIKFVTKENIKKRYFDVSITPIFNTENIKGYITQIQEITKRVNAEKKLLEERNKAKSYLDIAQVMIMVLDTKANIKLLNQKGCSVLECDEHNIIGKNFADSFLPAENKNKLMKHFMNVMENGEDVIKGFFECEIITKKGERRFTAWYSDLLRDKHNNIVGLLSSGEDITDRKITRIKLEQSLIEKETLLREIHHRVKNNLQVISSILSLQTYYTKDKNAIHVLEEGQNRIQTMALIHENLYQSDKLSNIHLPSYIPSLINNIFHTYQVNFKDISYHLDIDDITLDIDKAISCGLIINELVSNSLKYAFPNRCKGEIRLEFHKVDNIHNSNQNQKFIIILCDNGIGLSTHNDKHNTLGLRLVQILAKKLDAEINIENKLGTIIKTEINCNYFY